LSRVLPLRRYFGARLEVSKLLKLVKDVVVHALRVVAQNGLPSLSDLVDRPAGTTHQSCLHHVGHCPADPAVEDADTALDDLAAVVVRDAHLAGHDFPDLLDRPRLAILECSEDGSHERLVLGDCQGASVRVVAWQQERL
jgi:hypothetical protein